MTSVTRRKSSHHPNVSVTVPPPPAPRPRLRRSWSLLVLALGILLIVTISVITLAFWFIVGTSGVIYLNENALYFIRNVGLIGLMIGALGLFVAIGMFRRAALPTADLLEAVERVSAGDYDLEVEERGPREIRALTREFNGMVNQLRRRETSRRQLEAALARELQTRLDAFLSPDATLPRDPAALNRLTQLVRAWSTLALAENGELTLYREQADIGALVRHVLTERHPEASIRGVTLRAAIPDPSPIAQVDPTRLGQALTCLLNHALARSASESAVQVEVSESSRPKHLEVAVNDQGRVITPDEFRRLFTRLGSTDSATTGLELPLARKLVELHGGEISVTSDAEHGTTLTFSIPLE